MIECRKCSFTVISSMRHALSSNCCPSCGSALFGKVHLRRLSLFKQKIMSQGFASKLGDDDIFDISLFILTEFFPIKDGSSNSDEKASDEKVVDKESADIPVLDDDHSKAEEIAHEETYESIRNEVREEFLNSSEEEDLDEDLKVQRLKRIAKENKIKSKTVVRRIDS